MSSPSLTLKMILLGTDTTASAALKGLATKASSLPTALAGPLGKLGTMIGGEVGELVSKMTDGLEKLGEEGTGLGTKFQAGGAAVAGIGAAASLLGSKDKASLEQLKDAITATGGSYSDYQEDIEKTIKQQENYGNSATSVQNALQTLTSSTQDPAKAIANMGLVSDLAASKHEDLGTAATQVSKILAGTGQKTLGQYGITTKNMTLASQQLAAQLKGQAAASVDSWSGKLDVLKTKLGDQVAVLSQKFGPALTVAGTGVMAVGTVMQFMAARQAAAAVATEASTVATDEQAAQSKLAAAAQWLWNAAMDANPIALVVIAIVALIAIIVLIATKTTWFQQAWHAAWGAIQTAVSAVWNWIKTNWPLLLAILIGPIGLAVLAIVKNWNAISNGAQNVIGWVKSHWPLLLAIITGPFGLAVLAIVKNWKAITDGFGDVIAFFKNAPGKMASAVAGLFEGIPNAAKSAFNAVASFWNDTVGRISFKAPSWMPGIGGKGFSVPKIPLLAKGGIIGRAGNVIVGDDGPEMLSLQAGASVTPLSRVGGGGGQPLQVYLVVDGRTLGSVIATASHTGAPLNIRLAGV